MAVIIVAREGTAENRERVVEGRGFYPHVFIYLECQKNTLSEHRFIKSFWNFSYIFQFFLTYCGFFICDYANLHWACLLRGSICK